MIHSWRRKYMVVKDNRILVFDKKENTKARHVYEVLSLDNVSSIQFKNKFYFKIIFKDIKQKTLTLKLGYSEKEDAEDWETFFRTVYSSAIYICIYNKSD